MKCINYVIFVYMAAWVTANGHVDIVWCRKKKKNLQDEWMVLQN